MDMSRFYEPLVEIGVSEWEHLRALGTLEGNDVEQFLANHDKVLQMSAFDRHVFASAVKDDLLHV